MPPSAGDHAVSEEVSSYWVNFAKTGDPNGGARPHWLNLEKLQVLEGYYAWRRAEAVKKH